jgi:hypothetical protein
MIAAAQKEEYIATVGFCWTVFLPLTYITLGLNYFYVLYLWAKDTNRDSARGGLRQAMHPIERVGTTLLPAGYDPKTWFAPEYDRGVHVCGLGHLYKLTSTGLVKKNRGVIGQCVGAAFFMFLLPIHFLKTFDWTPLRMSWYGPPSEMNDIRNRHASAGLRPRSQDFDEPG